MSRVKKINDFTESCPNQLFNMCKVRDKSLRDCALPRCCTICPDVNNCNFICSPLMEELEGEDANAKKEQK